jgi:hypothetical protein
MDENHQNTIKLLIDTVAGTLTRLAARYEGIEKTMERVEGQLAKGSNIEVVREDLSRIHLDVRMLKDEIGKVFVSLSLVVQSVSGNEGLQEKVKENTAAMKHIGDALQPLVRVCEWLSKPVAIGGVMLASIALLAGLWQFILMVKDFFTNHP